MAASDRTRDHCDPETAAVALASAGARHILFRITKPVSNAPDASFSPSPAPIDDVVCERRAAISENRTKMGMRTSPIVLSYAEFVRTIVNRMNARVENRTNVECASLRLLPQRRIAEFSEFSTRVSKDGLFSIKSALYSAPSPLIGHRLVVRQYVDRIECWLGGKRVHECPRATDRLSQLDRRPPKILLRQTAGS